MIEEGVVVGYKGDNALVKIENDSACKGCASIGICKPTANETGVIAVVENTLGAIMGDRVVITVDTNELLRASLMIYIFPLVFFIAGVFLGEMLGMTMIFRINKDILSAVIGIIMFLLAFGIIRRYDSRWNRKKGHLPKIDRII